MGRQPLTQLILDPLLAFMIMAMGTVPVAAGMGDIPVFFSVVTGAPDQHVGAIFLSTLAGLRFVVKKQGTD